MTLQSSGPIKNPLQLHATTKHYSTLRYTIKRKIPTNDQVDLSREEDFFSLEEPKPQEVLRSMVYSIYYERPLPLFTLSERLQLKEVFEYLNIFLDSSPLDENQMDNPVILGALNTFSGMSLDSLNDVYASIRANKVYRCVL